MSLFLNTSHLYNKYQDCCTVDVSETIEPDCLSVLHKLHDQVNGLQLVQVVVQPLARLFNPASLAALAATSEQSPSSASGNLNTSIPSVQGGSSNSSATTDGQITATLATSLHTSKGNIQHENEGSFTTTGAIPTTNLAPSSHSRSASFASAFSSSGIGTATNKSTVSNSSTYMMSPDTAQALIARLDTDRDVNWLMEIIGYGLSMPFSLTGEQDSVKDCCTIYCEWLISALLPYDENNEDSKYQQLSKLVPVPIRQDPNRYARKMLSHLYNVFLPRQVLINSTVNQSQKEQTDAMLTAVSRQAVLCHRVLRTIENIAQNQSNLMDDETWYHLLALLLNVNDKLLSAPTEPDDIGTQLHDRILGVLFDLVLLASVRSIPTSNIWRTFHEMCLNWRHRPALVDHWRRITLMLSKRLASSLSEQGSQSTMKQESGAVLDNSLTQTGAIEAAINNMNSDTLSKTWFRFLNLIGNPVELSDPNIISRTDEFYHSACSSNNVLDPRQHPCLSALPQIFMNAMTGIREFTETFLGHYVTADATLSDVLNNDRSSRPSVISLSSNPPTSVSVAQPNPYAQPHQAITPTQTRKSGIKSISMKNNKSIPFTSTSGSHSIAMSPTLDTTNFLQQRPSLTSFSSRTSQTISQPSFKLYPDRPKCNSLLHIFGDWLFSAALLGSDMNQEALDPIDGGTSFESAASLVSSSTATEVSSSRGLSSPSIGARKNANQKSSGSSVRSSNQSTKQQENSAQDKVTLEPALCVDSFELGQAEAIAILCKIFASKTSAEEMSPSYLSRFYLCLQHCLNFGTGHDPRRTNSTQIGSLKKQLLAGVLVNSTNLLQKDLDGFNLLIPCFIRAIEYVFDCNEKDVPLQPPLRQNSRSGSFRQGSALPSANVTNSELRKACILLLVNLLAYPIHFQSLVIRSCLNQASPTITFASLRPRLLKLLFVALQTEKDPMNMQVLFGGLSVTIHDLVTNSAAKEEHIKTSHNSPASSLNVGNDNTSLDSAERQDDSVSQSSFVFNSNCGFLIKSLHVTCHLLINIWKHDTQVSLVALELLTSIARISTSPKIVEDEPHITIKSAKNHNNNNRIEMRNEYKQTTKWICDYICNQCSRPPPAHSRDMHSTIVAAYQCLSVWFYNHPYLLEDQSCVTTLIEVIELGVSGQKSKSSSVDSVAGTITQSVITKEDKVMKPSSMRVREAAESLLNICMIRSRDSSQCANSVMATFDTVLDESALAERFGGTLYRDGLRQVQDFDSRQVKPYQNFRYFSDDDSMIFALLEQPAHDASLRDSVICLMRTPFGRHCWKLKFDLLYNESVNDGARVESTNRSALRDTMPNQELKLSPLVGSPNKSLCINNLARFFPESIDDVEPNKLDKFVTTLEDYTNPQTRNSRLVKDVQSINEILSKQILAEQKVASESSPKSKKIECKIPQSTYEPEVARILANHLGLKTCLSFISIRDPLHQSLIDELKALDQYSTRICDSVSIFYVRRGRTNPKEILESVRARHNVSLEFFEWILELGQPTLVKNHNRWNSWANRYTLSYSVHNSQEDINLQIRNQMLSSDHGGAIFDGDRMTLYWSDMCQELAFLLPHKIERSGYPIDLDLQSRLKLNLSEHDGSTNFSDTSSHSPSSAHMDMRNVRRGGPLSTSGSANIDLNSDTQSICSVASDASSMSALGSQQATVHKDQQSTIGRDRRDSTCLSRQSTVTQKKKSHHTAPLIGCDTNIIICWLESPDDLDQVPTQSLLSVAENGHLIECDEMTCGTPIKSKDFVKYFISSMKNGLYRVNLSTSFGRHWLALPLVDGMTVSRAMLGSLIRESILNICRRRRLDADCYQPPHVKRRLKIQEICNNFKISSTNEPTEYYYNLFKSKTIT